MRRPGDRKITIALDPAEYSDIAALAKKEGIEMSAYWRIAMNYYLTSHDIQVPLLEIRRRRGPHPRRRHGETRRQTFVSERP